MNIKNTGMSPQYGPRYILSFFLWPFLFAVCMGITIYGFAHDAVLIYFNIAYVFLIVSLFLIERKMPHEAAWEQPDGQNLASILHTLSSKGTVQGIMLFSGTIGLASLITPVSEATGYGVWPREWPMALQVVLGLVAAEFGLYWAHRLGHEWKPLWHFHSIHHSVTKLWFLNTGRFHFIDSLVSIVMGIAILVALGAPMEVVQWQAAVTAFIGMLTHCNIEMRFGPLSWIFNTPELHRWHHSKKLHEGNSNYGENLILWDQIFGSYVRPDARAPKNIGITTFMPARFWHQIIWPFVGEKRRKVVELQYQE